MNDWSKWLDYQLQKLKPFVKTYLKDSQQVTDELKTIPTPLPLNAQLFTADANSMYDNIDTEHAIKVISWFLYKLGPPPLDSPSKLLNQPWKLS